MHTLGRDTCANETQADSKHSVKQSFSSKALQISLLVLLPLSFSVWGAAPLSDNAIANTRISTHQETGLVRFVGTEPGSPIRLEKTARTATHTDVGMAFIREYGAAFGIDNPDLQLRPLKVTPGSSALNSLSQAGLLGAKPGTEGGASMRYQQLHRGVPVFAGEFVVNLDGDNALLSMTGEIAADLTVSVNPTVTPTDAIDSALYAVAKWYNLDPAELQVSKPTLFVYDSRLVEPGASLPSLVWQMDVSTTELAPIRELILVDAHSGTISLHFNQVDMAKNRKTHDAGGMAAIPGTLMCSEGDSFPTCASSDADVINAHAHAGDAYDFYATTHGRDGIDDAGSVISSTVHYDDSWGTCPNAFWDGTQMVYCDGYADADDVVGHELTHGVTSKESRLVYYFESGAINESFSDIWGEFIDLSNATGNDSPSSRWLMGEDMPIGAIRDLQFPGDFGHPDSMTSALYWTSSSDNGGVHTNSGVGNKAAYLMTDGDTFNGISVNGLGVTKTAKIYYEAQTNLLTSGANYADLYDALYQACLNLVGTSGITANDCLEVRAATDAVEMNLNPTGFAPSAALCPDGEQQGTVLFSDDLESGTGNWTTESLAGAASTWSVATGYATSGVTSLWGTDPDYLVDAVNFNNAPVTLTGNTYLHFRHSYAFESWSSSAGQFFYDGGVVEYSTDGSTWHDLGTLFDTGQNYNETIFTGYGNPLAGRSAFAGASHGYVSSRFDLGTLAGQNFQFRFRLGSDESVGGPFGWLVDDVAIYSCGSAAAEPPPVEEDVPPPPVEEEAPPPPVELPSCSGIDVLVQNRNFGDDTSCTADSSIEANSGVVVKSGSIVQFNSPSTTLGPGFSIEQGSSFTITYTQ